MKWVANLFMHHQRHIGLYDDDGKVWCQQRMFSQEDGLILN